MTLQKEIPSDSQEQLPWHGLSTVRPDERGRPAVKIVGDQGTESLKIVELG